MRKSDLARMWEFFRLLYPCQVALITAAHGGRRDVMTSSAMPVSFKPPLLAVSISPKRFTYELIKAQGEFVVNVAPRSLMDKALLCGLKSGREVDKFEEVGLTPGRAKRVDVPIVEECLAHLECRVVREVEAGDHSLFIGEVLAAYAADDMLARDDDGIALWDLTKAEVLLHVGGAYFTVARDMVRSSVKYSFFRSA
ncbi:flavin reductase [Candidatus Geothermarchaeota archaeon ex4572_27]|nr:MAG: flavin reductase [Candidatus Geothermarchaeota archaeon ex4572_27]